MLGHTSEMLGLLDRQLSEINMKRPRGALNEYDLFKTLEVILRVLRHLAMRDS